MDDAALVRRIERVSDLPREGERIVNRHRTLAQTLGQRVALNELQNQRRLPGVVFDAVDRADVRMVERGEYPRLAFEAREAFRIMCNAAGRILMATSRPSLASRARYTSPIPPAPSGDWIS